MGNNSSSLQSKTSSTNMGTSNDLINKLFENNNVDSLNMTEDNTNKEGSSIPVIRVSHLPQIGGANIPVANKYSNEFINNMNKNRIFNLIHDTEIQEYHLNNMVKQGILNNDATPTTMTGGYVPPTNTTNATNVNESDVSDAMNRIKEVIVNELKEQELKGGANNNTSDSNTDGCGCGGNDDGKKHSNKCEYGKKKKSKKSKGKTYESSMRNSEDSSSSSSSSSDEDGAINSNNGLTIFPFNSSDVSDKNYRLTRRKK